MGTDYIEFGDIDLFYRGGRHKVDLVEFSVTIINDDVPEPCRERFEIHGVATRNLYFPFPYMTVTIVDDDSDCDGEYYIYTTNTNS